MCISVGPLEYLNLVVYLRCVMSVTLQEIYLTTLLTAIRSTLKRLQYVTRTLAVKEVFAVLQKRLHYYKSICDITKT